MRVIRNIESTSIGKTRKKNDDGMYIGENFAAVIDGVSSKSFIYVDSEKVNIADIIVDAIKKIDRPTAPVYAKELNLEEFTRAVNMYIKKFCDAHDVSLTEHKLEATAAIYSKFYNQIWLVGDCRAVYDGQTIDNELKADDLYAEIRLEIIKSLLSQGYTKEDLFREDVSSEMIKYPETRAKFISDKNEVDRLNEVINQKMHQALLDAGFTEKEIEDDNLLKKYIHPQLLQEYAKNNPNAKLYGYSVFNGIYTPIENCKIVDLPENVKNIRLSTDGFPMKILTNAQDMGEAIRMNRMLAFSDPISIKQNYGIHNSVPRGDGKIAFDDETAIDIRIDRVKEERDDER